MGACEYSLVHLLGSVAYRRARSRTLVQCNAGPLHVYLSAEFEANRSYRPPCCRKSSRVRRAPLQTAATDWTGSEHSLAAAATATCRIRFRRSPVRLAVIGCSLSFARRGATKQNFGRLSPPPYLAPSMVTERCGRCGGLRRRRRGGPVGPHDWAVVLQPGDCDEGRSPLHRSQSRALCSHACVHTPTDIRTPDTRKRAHVPARTHACAHRPRG
jgi:hypothetical protein